MMAKNGEVETGASPGPKITSVKTCFPPLESPAARRGDDRYSIFRRLRFKGNAPGEPSRWKAGKFPTGFPKGMKGGNSMGSNSIDTQFPFLYIQPTPKQILIH
jgi:hypothetical protein